MTPLTDFEPLNERVVVERRAADTKTAGGLYIPASAVDRDKPTIGTVVAVAANSPVEIGDTVLYAKYAGTEFNFQDKEYLMLDFKELFGRVRKI